MEESKQMIDFDDYKKIIGERIYLRPITLEDTDLIVSLRNSKFVKNYFIYRENFTNEMHINWMRTKVFTGEVVQYIICEVNRTPIGSVYYRDINEAEMSAEFGIFIGEENIGKGYGTEATSMFIKFGFDKMHLNKINLRVIDSNFRAQHVYEKFGFRKTHEELVDTVGGGLNVIFMELTNPKSLSKLSTV